MPKTENTIPPYKHRFSAQSLKRAREYVDFIENAHLSQNSLSCKVEGSYPYKVKIAWSENDYTELSCTCPYDYEGYCKHIAAALMYLEEELPEETVIPKKQQKPEWKKIIEKLSKEELLSLLTEYAADDENLINTILIKHAASTDKVDIQKYKKIADNIFNAASDDFGFIHYQDVYSVSHMISNLLNKATNGIENKKFQESFSISAAIAEVCINYIQNMDDSSGWIGGLIYEAFEKIENVFHKCENETLRNQIFEWLDKQMRNKDYSDYGCEEALASIYFELGNSEPYTKSVFQYIDDQIAIYKNGTDWSSKYRYSKLLDEKLTLLQKTGKEQDAQSLVEENLQLSDIRKIKVNQLMEQKDFSQAISLIKEGIKISEQENLAGVTRNWNNFLLQIYREQNLREELQTLSRSMFLHHPDSMEYYVMYKKTVEKTKWNTERMY
ncbi:SWIM zinc finger family protein [Petrimonas sp.]|uniref:SWIM zinc finger family protein n=1 Tax=Petrimonas sp. TaxID=2023866 RepID=UPI003F5165FC